MKKICFVTMGNLYTIPYLEMYRNIIGNSFDIIYWDREDKKEEANCKTAYVFRYNINNCSKIQKAYGFLRYRRFIAKCLKNTNYDVVILLQTWCALLLFGIINQHYKGKYIIDIRDYTYENNIVVRFLERNIFRNAKMRLISSEGFKSFLPGGLDYCIIHNLRQLDEKEVIEISNREYHNKPINISFIGYVSYMETNKKLIQALGNDERFHISFIGTNAMKLKDYCEQNEILNVTLIDTFNPNEIIKFYRDTDIINNLYGYNDPKLDYALSNKLYFAIQLNIPILVFKGTFMAEIASSYGFGIEVVDINSYLANYLYYEYSKINRKEMRIKLKELLRKIEFEQNETINALKKVVL